MIHKFCVLKNNKLEWKNDLKLNDILVCTLNNELKYNKIVNIDIKNYKGFVYDLSVAKCKNYFANNILCHNTSNNILDLK